MAGVWKKTLNYLGLVEDDEEFVDDMPEVEPAPVRRMKPQAVRGVSSETEGVVRTISSPRVATASSAIYKSEPKRFNEARDVADRFKEGTAVIMNLQSTDDTIARRLVDFASGLVYGLDGKIELVANRVYLLTPANVEVSAEEREKIAGGMFYNQFWPDPPRKPAGVLLLAFPPDDWADLSRAHGCVARPARPCRRFVAGVLRRPSTRHGTAPIGVRSPLRGDRAGAASVA